MQIFCKGLNVGFYLLIYKISYRARSFKNSLVSSVAVQVRLPVQFYVNLGEFTLNIYIDYFFNFETNKSINYG